MIAKAKKSRKKVVKDKDPNEVKALKASPPEIESPEVSRRERMRSRRRRGMQ